MKKVNFLVLLIGSLILMASCASPSPIRVKEVYIPVKCEIPKVVKPQYDGTFESAKKLTQYYLTIENLLFQCAKEVE